MTRTPRLVVAVSIVAFLTAGCGRPGLQRDADREAAAFADTSLLRQVTQAAEAAPPEERPTAARRWLENPDESYLAGTSDTAWLVRGGSTDEIPVTIYYNWENTSFSAEQAWGVACRLYRVGATVTVRAVECPEGTEPSPGAQDGLVGWYYR
ncbi:MAG: hypothetical protein ACRCYX_06450 [Dermatophilaceae bacterium]